MDQCRLCLSKRRNLRSLFYVDNGISYVDMVSSIANIKIFKEDSVPDNICLACRKKLREAYDFKLMIESSDLALHENTNLIKRISFSNLNDIKIKVEFTDSTDFIEHKNIYETNEKNFDSCFNSGEKAICYKNTVITKLDPDQRDVNTNFNMADNVHDFLRTFKDEPDYDCYDDSMHDYQDCVDDGNEDYNVPIKDRLKKKKEKPAAIKRELKTVFIKPVKLKDIILIRNKSKKKCNGSENRRLYKKSNMCNFCGKMVTNIKVHILQHTGERSYKCKTCPKAFLSKHSLKYHERKHTIEKNFQCDQCSAKFKDKCSLRSHLMVHVEEKNHICPICNKAFKRKRAMIRHVPIHSAASKSIKCELCNMSFLSPYGLKHHMRVHTGERPYRCEMCSQNYSYKHDFNRHCLKKHGVFFKRRSVYIMNEEVLQQERKLMGKIMLSVQGVIKDDEPFKVFEVPQGQAALAQAIKLIESKQISVDLNF